MQPNPSAETLRPPRPNCRSSTDSSNGSFLCLAYHAPLIDPPQYKRNALVHRDPYESTTIWLQRCWSVSKDDGGYSTGRLTRERRMMILIHSSVHSSASAVCVAGGWGVQSVLQNKVPIGHSLSPIIIDTCRFTIGSDFCKTL